MTFHPPYFSFRRGCLGVLVAATVFLWSQVVAFSQNQPGQEGEGAPNSQQSHLEPLPEAAIDTGTLTLADPSGAIRPLSELTGTSATVIVFLYATCPLCQRAAPVLEKLWKEEQPHGVRLLGVFTDGTPVADLEKFKKTYGVSFPLFVDNGGKVASSLSATATPEAFVLDRHGKVRYMGRINDLYQVRGVQTQAPVREDLREALSDVVSGSAVRVPRTLPVGCAIVRQDPLPSATPTTPKETMITYHKDVAPILRNHCMSCHSEGNAGPFPLVSYDDAADWMKTGLREIQAGRMPPAQVESDLAIRNANTISAAEVKTLESWIKSGKQEGDTNSAPPLDPLPDFSKFQEDLGPPDIILEQGEPFHLGPIGSDVYRHLVFTLNSSTDLRVRVIQFLPSNRTIVHHALIGYLPHPEAEQALRNHGGPGPTFTEGDKGPGFWARHGVGFRIAPPRPDGMPLLSFLSGYVPGTSACPAPEDADFIIPAGSDLIAQMHYHRNGIQSQDSTRIGLWLRKDGKIPPKIASFRFLHGEMVVIPSGIKSMKVSGEWTVPEDCMIAGIIPHAHLLAQSLDATAILPDQSQFTISKVPHWQYEWQQPYFFKEPRLLPKGTKIRFSAIYDNSPANPKNPYSPPQPLFLGEETTDEMLLPMLVLTSEKVIDPNGNSGFTLFGASLMRANLLRNLYNDHLDFEVQADGTVLRAGATVEGGRYYRFKKPLDPALPPSAYEDQLP
ncbi:MAG: redoxin domain-containing protein [Chthoniobacterales bacterium]